MVATGCLDNLWLESITIRSATKASTNRDDGSKQTQWAV
jgi:hypothetical protein